jgi:hypothetical protein
MNSSEELQLHLIVFWTRRRSGWATNCLIGGNCRQIMRYAPRMASLASPFDSFLRRFMVRRKWQPHRELASLADAVATDLDAAAM